MDCLPRALPLAQMCSVVTGTQGIAPGRGWTVSGVCFAEHPCPEVSEFRRFRSSQTQRPRESCRSLCKQDSDSVPCGPAWASPPALQTSGSVRAPRKASPTGPCVTGTVLPPHHQCFHGVSPRPADRLSFRTPSPRVPPGRVGGGGRHARGSPCTQGPAHVALSFGPPGIGRARSRTGVWGRPGSASHRSSRGLALRPLPGLPGEQPLQSPQGS